MGGKTPYLSIAPKVRSAELFFLTSRIFGVRYIHVRSSELFMMMRLGHYAKGLNHVELEKAGHDCG